jgi:hypothetical protein
MTRQPDTATATLGNHDLSKTHQGSSVMMAIPISSAITNSISTTRTRTVPCTCVLLLSRMLGLKIREAICGGFALITITMGGQELNMGDRST